MKLEEKIYETVAGFVRTHFTKMHLRIFLVMYAVFALLTFGLMMSGSANDRRENQIIRPAVWAGAGPFTGAIARPSQTDCLKFSIKILPWPACFLAVGLLVQLFPFKSTGQFVRLGLWSIGLLVWFGSGVWSLLYALS